MSTIHFATYSLWEIVCALCLTAGGHAELRGMSGAVIRFHEDETARAYAEDVRVRFDAPAPAIAGVTRQACILSAANLEHIPA